MADRASDSPGRAGPGTRLSHSILRAKTIILAAGYVRAGVFARYCAVESRADFPEGC
jgi:hypothetical protein